MVVLEEELRGARPFFARSRFSGEVILVWERLNNPTSWLLSEDMLANGSLLESPWMQRPGTNVPTSWDFTSKSGSYYCYHKQLRRNPCPDKQVPHRHRDTCAPLPFLNRVSRFLPELCKVTPRRFPPPNTEIGTAIQADCHCWHGCLGYQNS